MQRRLVMMWDVIDESERYLDERGLDRPHLAGHSRGGFIALELARRGRAASVCAFSPGGLWSDDLRTRAISPATFSWPFLDSFCFGWRPTVVVCPPRRLRISKGSLRCPSHQSGQVLKAPSISLEET